MLFDLLQTVDQGIAVHMELAGCLCNIEIILEKPVDSPQCLFIKRRRDIRTEYFFQKTFAQRNRELISAPNISFRKLSHRETGS